MKENHMMETMIAALLFAHYSEKHHTNMEQVKRNYLFAAEIAETYVRMKKNGHNTLN